MRDSAIAAVRALVTGDPQQVGEARERAAQVVARAQNISVEDARTQVQQYAHQYRQAVDQAKQQVTQAADAAQHPHSAFLARRPASPEHVGVTNPPSSTA